MTLLKWLYLSMTDHISNSIHSSFVTLYSLWFWPAFDASEQLRLSQLLIIKLYNPDFEKLLQTFMIFQAPCKGPHPFFCLFSFPQVRENKGQEPLENVITSSLATFILRAESRTDHFQHVRSSRLNGSPEGIVQVNDLSLNRFVFCANVCAYTETHRHTQILKTSG